MPVHLLGWFRQRVPKEKELQQAEARLRQAVVPLQFGNHPVRSELELFANGQYPSGDPKMMGIFDHLHDCDSCLAIMAEIRSRSRTEERPITRRRNRLLFSTAAIVLVVVGLFIWVVRGPKPSAVATVDLRQVTRGQEGSSIIVNRDSRAIRVLLPPGSVSGTYQVGIFNSAVPSTPEIMSSAQSRSENGDEVVITPIRINTLKPGSYLLGVRHSGSEWSTYVINIK